MLDVLFFLRFRMSVPEQDTVHRVCVEEVNMFVILWTKIGNVINHQEHTEKPAGTKDLLQRTV